MAGFLSQDEQMILKEAHRAAQGKRSADRIKAILLLNEGWSYEQIATALLLDETTARRYLKIYQRKGLDGLLENLYEGRDSKLDLEQIVQLKEHLQQVIYSDAKAIVAYVAKTFDVHYTREGLTHLLHRLGFVYKKTKLVPGKADAEKQQAFLEEVYQKLKEQKGVNDRIYFMDGTHPHHNPMPAYGWILKGQSREIPTHTGRERLNLNGALDISDLDMIFRQDETINAQSTLALLQEMEARNPLAESIYVIADNARYYRNKRIKEFLQDSKIQLIFLPPYSPNLNLIERLWKFFHKKVLYHHYYSDFDAFKKACDDFFHNLKIYRQELKTLLTENFQIIGQTLSQS